MTHLNRMVSKDIYKHEKEDNLGLLPVWDSEYEVGVGKD